MDHHAKHAMGAVKGSYVRSEGEDLSHGGGGGDSNAPRDDVSADAAENGSHNGRNSEGEDLIHENGTHPDAAASAAAAAASSGFAPSQGRAEPSLGPGAYRVAGPGAFADPPHPPGAPRLRRADNEDTPAAGDGDSMPPTPSAMGHQEAIGDVNVNVDGENATQHPEVLEGYVAPVRPPRVQNASVSLPQPPLVEGTIIAKKQTKKSGCNKSYLIGATLLITVVIVAAVVGGMVGKSRSRSTEAEAEAEQAQTPPPTPPPPSKRYVELRSAILSAIPDVAQRERTARALQELSSPQGRALQWLDEEDGLSVDPTSDAGAAQAVQRYALAVAYYSMGGEEWINSANFLSNASECEWNRVEDDPSLFEAYSFVGANCTQDDSTVDQLWLANNHLVGTLPEDLSMLTGWTHMVFSGNFLAGTIPLELPPLLEYVGLDVNKLTGSVPTELARLSELENLWLYDNSLTGLIPSELGQVSKLQGLSIEANKLTGSIPTELGVLEDLWYLGLSDNLLTGTIPSELGQLTLLEELYLDKNSLSGSVPDSVCALKETGVLLEIVVRSPSEPPNDVQCSCCGDRVDCSATEPCVENWFCNYDFGEEGFCEECGTNKEPEQFTDFCEYMGLPQKGLEDCREKCPP